MTDPVERGELESDEREDEVVRRWVKRALADDAALREPPDILRGVQRRIRQRSRGKVLANRWDTVHVRLAYVLVPLITLLLAAVAYYALAPAVFR